MNPRQKVYRRRWGPGRPRRRWRRRVHVGQLFSGCAGSAGRLGQPSPLNTEGTRRISRPPYNIMGVGLRSWCTAGMPQVDALLRSHVLSSLERFRVPASEPIWSENGEPTRTGAQLVFYVTRTTQHFGSPGGFWVDALFNFLEDRSQPDVLAEAAGTSLCREVTPTEAIGVLERRLGRSLEGSERATMLLAGGRTDLRVFEMLATEALWAGLCLAEDAYVAAFVDSTSGQ